jgi:hypothetical protein
MWLKRIDSDVVITSFLDCGSKRHQGLEKNARDNQMFSRCVGFDGSDAGQC